MTSQAAPHSAKPARAAERDVEETSRMSFGDHLEELRDCLIRATLGVAAGTVLAMIFGKQILEIIYRPLLVAQYVNGLSPELQALSPTAAFAAYLKIAFLSGLIISMPWVLYQVWLFVASGLYAREQRFVKLLVPTSAGLFAVGVLFLYYIVLPMVLHFFITFNRTFGVPDLTPTALQQLLLPRREIARPTPEPAELPNATILQEAPVDPKPGQWWVDATTRRLMLQTDSGVWSTLLEPGQSSPAIKSQFAIDFYISFVLTLALAFGITFETPLVVLFLAWSRIVTRAAMVQGRRYILLGTVILAAVMTPPDVVSQLLLATPMYLLFELGLLAARLVETRKPPV